jgi:hypothetical protein
MKKILNALKMVGKIYLVGVIVNLITSILAYSGYRYGSDTANIVISDEDPKKSKKTNIAGIISAVVFLLTVFSSSYFAFKAGVKYITKK